MSTTKKSAQPLVKGWAGQVLKLFISSQLSVFDGSHDFYWGKQ